MSTRKSNGQFKKGNPGKPLGAKSHRSVAAQIKGQLEEITRDSLDILSTQVESLRELPPSVTGIKDVASSVGVLLNYVLPKKTEVTEFTHDHVAQTFEEFANWLEDERGVPEDDLGRLKGLMVEFLDAYAAT